MKKSLSKFFSPNSIAIIGASHEPGKVGYEIVNNLISGEYKGKVFLINPKAGKILGKKVFKNLSEIDTKIDLAIIIVPAKICPEVLEEIGKKKIKQAIIISAGFREIGKEGIELENEIKKIAEKYKIFLLGPNCLGLINSYQNLNASFGPEIPQKGNIFFISQSGAILCGFLDLANQNNLGFSKIVSLGNKADLSENDFLEFALKDFQTKVILLYLESFVDGKKTIEILASQNKPVILLKGGQSEKGKKAVSSHTGSLAGSNEALEAFIEKTNIIKADSLKDLFDLAKGFSFQNPLIKNQIAILTNAGGLGVLGTDKLESVRCQVSGARCQGLELAELSKETRDFLRKNLPAACSVENPVDIIGDATTDRYKIGLEALLKDKNVSAVLVFLTPQKMTDSEKTAETIVALSKKFKKPILTCFFGQEKVEKAIKILEENKIPNFDSPEKAVEIIQKMRTPAFLLNIKPEKIFFDNYLFLQQIGKYFEKKEGEQKILEPEKVAEILKILKIPYPKFKIAFSEKEAIDQAKKVGYPLTIKTACSKIFHKKDVDGVKLNLKNEEEARRAYQKIVENVKNVANEKNNKEVKKVIIQKMIKDGGEIIIGMKRDEQFGPLIMFGLGGIFVEVLKDISFGIAPLNYNEASEMISSIKGYKILKGARGEKEKDIDSIIEILLKISELSLRFPQIKEIDLNPIKVFEKGCSVLDFKIVLG